MPKAKFSKEQIEQAAFDIACESGFEQLTIRNIAKRLGSSIAPIYVNFTDADELRQTVINKAITINKQILSEQNSGDPFLDLGIASVIFAKRYPRIYDEIVIRNNNAYQGQVENERFAIAQMKQDPQMSSFSEDQLRLVLIKMQALQAGLSLLARKDYYKDILTDEMIIRILDETGIDVLDGMNKREKAE